MALFAMPNLQKVYLSADVYAMCMQHALTTEKQEIMGLLLGDVSKILFFHHLFTPHNHVNIAVCRWMRTAFPT